MADRAVAIRPRPGELVEDRVGIWIVVEERLGPDDEPSPQVLVLPAAWEHRQLVDVDIFAARFERQQPEDRITVTLARDEAEALFGSESYHGDPKNEEVHQRATRRLFRALYPGVDPDG
jgi:hypothetical protein